jgi:hypothetical protein
MTDMQTSFPLLIVRPSILNPVINFSTHLWPVKWNALGYTFTLHIPFHLLQCRCNTWPNMINNDMIHSISLRDHIGSSILTSLTLHRCFGPSVPSHHSTCPSYLQSVRRAKSCLDLLHLDHMTQCHVSCAMSSFIITCVSFAISLSHLHRHGICYSHPCIYGLIIYVSHINTISPPKVVTQLPKPNKDLSISPFLVIDDNTTKIWKLSSFGFELLAQAILPCVNDFGQVPQTWIGSISSPYICAIVFGSKHAHIHILESWESDNY